MQTFFIWIFFKCAGLLFIFLPSTVCNYSFSNYSIVLPFYLEQNESFNIPGQSMSSFATIRWKSFKFTPFSSYELLKIWWINAVVNPTARCVRDSNPTGLRQFSTNWAKRHEIKHVVVVFTVRSLRDNASTLLSARTKRWVFGKIMQPWYYQCKKQHFMIDLSFLLHVWACADEWAGAL